MQAFTPLTAFNGRLPLSTAYVYTKQEIYGFLNAVVANPGNYGVPDANRQHLAMLRDNIVALGVPDGALYIRDTPRQQLLRQQGVVALSPTNAIPWVAKQERYFLMFDLLGVFLSLCGPAPANATARNYHLPLVAVYARWCGTLAASKGKTPTVAQITWGVVGGATHSFLGASAQGYDNGGNWPNLVKQTRFNYVNGGGLLHPPWGAFNDSPKIHADGAAGTHFGNCGETYPFLYILTQNSTFTRGNAQGIAVKVAKCTPRTPQTPYDAAFGSTLWDTARMHPCDNCAELINTNGGTLANFQL
ncbi:hypothetical protein FN846DRAFT_954927, partial [Sphaerosporella brunnea]